MSRDPTLVTLAKLEKMLPSITKDPSLKLALLVELRRTVVEIDSGNMTLDEAKQYMRDFLQLNFPELEDEKKLDEVMKVVETCLRMCGMRSIARKKRLF